MIDQTPPKPRKTGAMPRKAPRLTPEIQSRIGDKLRAMYDDVVQEGVPDRFADLLKKLEAGEKKE